MQKRGEVYLMLADTGHYKIGCAVSARKRVRCLNVELPIGVELIHAIQVSDRYRAERVLHQMFGAKKVRGEWFALSRRDVGKFKRIKSEQLEVHIPKPVRHKGVREAGAPLQAIVETFTNKLGWECRRLKCGHVLNNKEDFIPVSFWIGSHFCRHCLAEGKTRAQQLGKA
jgi:hypothetical protein